ncbi:MAG: SAM-dependent methyltransferase [Candidatus Marinimicrobia bacterium]|nr:SAM-dependent methyltransferase [Candidatus Neomarinimicrobiota bacterium]|tara:strand:+ start:612 stop:1202 length:591 start_codon:yes stop_codon:yes gene_type:complete
MNKTIDYYNNNAEEFFKNTLKIKLNDLYNKFLEYIPVGGRLLDLGCGSGRDTLYFLENGYDVTSLDGSQKMVQLSSELTKKKTLFMRIEDIDFQNQFDGIWACASLLHIKKNITENIYSILCDALIDKGILYASYRYGRGASTLEGRYYNNYDEKSFTKMIENVERLHAITYWITNDMRPDIQDEQWLNILLKKTI